MEKSKHGYGSGRSKIYLDMTYSRYFEQTPANTDKVEQIKQRREHTEGILLEIKALREQLENPIDSQYFQARYKEDGA